MHELTGRHEIKHYINYADLMQLRSSLPLVMERDEHSVNEHGYQVRSLYFDNYADKALLEKLNGVDEREKFRLRLYNGSPNLINLEKKSKCNGLSYKETAGILQSACEALLKGDYSALGQADNSLLMEFYAKLYFQQLRPRTIVEYEREAFKLSAGNVRVTLDHHIRSTSQPGYFTSRSYPSLPLPDVCVLEVKYDHYLPEVVRAVTALSSRRSSSFSKYAVSRLNQE